MKTPDVGTAESMSEEARARIARDQAIARLCNRLESYLAKFEPFADQIVAAAIEEHDKIRRKI